MRIAKGLPIWTYKCR